MNTWNNKAVVKFFLPLFFAWLTIATCASAQTLATQSVTTTAEAAKPMQNFKFAPFSARYKVIKSGISIGHAEFELSMPSPDVWQYKSRIEPIGIAKMFVSDQFFENTTVIIKDNAITPISYNYKRTGSKAESASIKFNWSKKTAEHQNMDKSSKISIAANYVDRYAVILNLMRDAALKQAKSEYFIIEKDVKLYQYNLLAKTNLKQDLKFVNLGNATTVEHIKQTNNSNREVDYFFADKLNFVPIKIEQFKDGKSILKMQLDQFQWQ